MKNKEKALIILESLDKYGLVSIDWNHEKNLILAITRGLKEIEEKEERLNERTVNNDEN